VHLESVDWSILASRRLGQSQGIHLADDSSSAPGKSGPRSIMHIIDYYSGILDYARAELPILQGFK